LFQLFYDKLFRTQILSDSSLKLKRVESPDRKVLFYFDEVISNLFYFNLRKAWRFSRGIMDKSRARSIHHPVFGFQIASSNMVCVTVTFQRAFEVGKPQPSTVSVYSYYEPGKIC